MIGLGIENYALLEFLVSNGERFPITIFTFQSCQEMEITYPKLKKWKHVKWKIGVPQFDKLKEFSLIIRSPSSFFSLELRLALSKNKSVVISPMQLL